MTSFANTFPASLHITAFGGTVRPAASVAAVSGSAGSLDLTASAGLVPVSNNGPQGLTYNSAGTGPAPAATTTAPNGTSYPIGAVVSKDLINQALAAATQAGVLNTTLTSAEVPALAQIGPLLSLFNLSTTISNVRLRLVPSSAPALSLAASGPSLGTISINNFTVIVDIQTAGQTAYTPLLSLTFSASAGFTLSQVGTKSLRPVLTTWPSVQGKSLTDLSSGLVLPRFGDRCDLEPDPVAVASLRQLDVARDRRPEGRAVHALGRLHLADQHQRELRFLRRQPDVPDAGNLS